jgi:hypothetical protein
MERFILNTAALLTVYFLTGSLLVTLAASVCLAALQLIGLALTKK